jgi:hypothetical protein
MQKNKLYVKNNNNTKKGCLCGRQLEPLQRKYGTPPLMLIINLKSQAAAQPPRYFLRGRPRQSGPRDFIYLS